MTTSKTLSTPHQCLIYFLNPDFFWIAQRVQKAISFKRYVLIESFYIACFFIC